MKKWHFSVVVVLSLVLLASFVTAAMGVHLVWASAGMDQTYGGDDAYDPAAGGNPELSLGVTTFAAGGYSGDDAYDPAAGGNPELSLSVTTAGENSERSAFAARGYSGDDAYDPAANSAPDLPVLVLPQPATLSAAATFGGDDAYDPAAGAGAMVACAQSEDELSARGALAILGGFGGDDDYDPAAGGAPELSLQEFIAGDSLAVDCDRSVPGN